MVKYYLFCCILGFQDYSYLFYIADGLFFVGIILIFLLDVDVERMETGSLKSNLAKIIRMVDVDIFMFMMLILGTCWGFLESFLFVFLMELNASSLLLGKRIFCFFFIFYFVCFNVQISALRNDPFHGLHDWSTFPLHLWYGRAQNWFGQRNNHCFYFIRSSILWLFTHLVKRIFIVCSFTARGACTISFSGNLGFVLYSKPWKLWLSIWWL